MYICRNRPKNKAAYKHYKKAKHSKEQQKLCGYNGNWKRLNEKNYEIKFDNIVSYTKFYMQSFPT